MNIYLREIISLSLSNKYTQWYCNIIEKAIPRTKMLDYYENHHILPKSFKMGGEYDTDNLVKLTAKEHFICHRLLPKMLVDKKLRLKMICAVLYMSYGNRQTPTHIPPAFVVEEIRKSLSRLKRGTTGKKWSTAQREKLKNRVPHNRGIPMSEDAKANLREKRRHQVIGPRKSGTKDKISNNLKGKTMGLTMWNNGQISVKSALCPGPNWFPGHIRKTVATKLWWTDGKKEIREEKSPGINWRQGRLVK